MQESGAISIYFSLQRIHERTSYYFIILIFQDYSILTMDNSAARGDEGLFLPYSTCKYVAYFLKAMREISIALSLAKVEILNR